VVTTVALLAVVAATAGALRDRGLHVDAGAGVHLGGLPERWAQDLVVAVLAVGCVVSLTGLGVLARLRRSRRDELPDDEEEEPPPGWVRKAVALAMPAILLGALVVATARHHEPPPLAPAGPPPDAPQAPPASPAPPVDWWLVAGIVVVVVAGGLVALRRLAPPARPWGTAERDDRVGDALRDAVDRSLEALLAEPDHRRAVVAAYGRMEELLADVGVPRAPWEAPTEYLARVVRLGGGRAATAATLTELFSEARFSPHPVDRASRDRAVGALVALRDELAVEAAR
jgi:hypothetical protein